MADLNYDRQMIRNTFERYGYKPSEEELDQFIPIANLKNNNAEKVLGSVGNYVRTVRLQQERKKNDPLNQVIADERGFFSDSQRKATEQEEALKGPVKLFGGLSPEQIDQYMAPVQQATREGGARLEGAASRRGIAGSSTEFNALAENERKFRENTLSTGLQVGMSERDRTQQLLQSLQGLMSGSLGRQGNIAGVQSEMAADDTRYLSELPLYLRGLSSQENAMEEAANARADAASKAKRAGIARLVGTGLGIGAGLLVPGGGFIAPALLGNLGGSAGDAMSGGGGSVGPDLMNLAAMMQASRPTPRFRGGGSYSVPAAGPGDGTYTG